MADATTTNDLIENTIGKFGLWQLGLSIIIIFSKFPTSLHQGSVIYIAPSNIKFTCKNPVIIESDKVCKIECSKYNYDTTIFKKTIASEFDLVCDKKYLIQFVHTVFMIGNGFGNLAAGVLADMYGRKLIFVIYIILQLLITGLIAISPNYLHFIILRFFSGIAVGGLGIGYVILLEIIGGKYREIISCIYLLTFPLGLMTLAIVAYIYRSWRPLYVFFTIIAFIILLSTYFIPESPRYLLTKNEIDKCVKILERGAKRNNLPTEKIREIVEREAKEKSMQQIDKPKTKTLETISTLLFHKQLRLKTFICNYMFFTSGVIFFGILQFIGRLDDDLFVSSFFAALTGIPGLFISMFLNKYYARKKILFISCLIVTTGMIFVIIFGVSKVSVIASQTSLFGLAVLVTTMTIFVAEYFPTTVRTSAVGLCFSLSNFGSALSSFPPNLADYAIWAPPLFFAIMSGFGCLILLFIPETKGIKLVQTVNDVEN